MKMEEWRVGDEEGIKDREETRSKTERMESNVSQYVYDHPKDRSIRRERGDFRRQPRSIS